MSALQSIRTEILAAILSAYTNLTQEALASLIHLTSGVSGVSFVALNNYESDKSAHTESANHVINIGASYANMKVKDADIYKNFDVDSVDVEAFNYATINTNGMSLEEYKAAVKAALPAALAELQAGPKTRTTESNDIYINKALVWNTNTNRLSVVGMSVNKVVTEKGEFKVVKSAPKTIAKKLIEKAAKGRTQTLRRFALDNLTQSITLKGETIEVGVAAQTETEMA